MKKHLKSARKHKLVLCFLIGVAAIAVSPRFHLFNIRSLNRPVSEIFLQNPSNEADLEYYMDSNKEWAQRIAQNPNGRRVVFLGDSITSRWSLERYFNDPNYINRGIRGETTGQMLERFKQDVIDLKPRAAIIHAGTNDISRGIPSEIIQNNLTMMCQLALTNHIKAILTTILPRRSYSDHTQESDRIKAMNEWIRSYTSQNKLGYVDYFSEVADKDGLLAGALADDSIHPNDKGYRIMARLAEAEIARQLQNQR